MLELEFLRRVDWKIVPCPEGLVDSYRVLVGRVDQYVLKDNALLIKESAPLILPRERTATNYTTWGIPIHHRRVLRCGLLLVHHLPMYNK